MENLKKLESKYVNKLKNYLTKIFKITRKNEMRILPGNIAFFIMLSIVPAITLAGVIGVHFTDSFSQVINFINLTLPKGVSSILLSFLENAVVKNYNVFVYLLLGFIIASNGANSIIIASNTLYDVENKNYVFRRIKAFFLTIMLMLLFIFILIGLAFSNVIYRTLADLNLILFNKQILFLYNFFKWPFAFFIIFFIIKLLYTMSVDKKINSHYTNKGAIFTTIGWIILTAVYSIYTSNYANYDIFYGSLSNLIVLMFWVYMLSYILVIGIAINAGIYSEMSKNGKIIDKK